MHSDYIYFEQCGRADKAITGYYSYYRIKNVEITFWNITHFDRDIFLLHEKHSSVWHIFILGQILC